MKTTDIKQTDATRKMSDASPGSPRMAQNWSPHLFPAQFPYYDPKPDMWKWMNIKRRLIC